MKAIILATNNLGKIGEFQSMLSSWFDCIPQQSFKVPPIHETKLSFVENAILKARHASSYGHQASLADDSGLVVPALHGQPGIYSARYAGLGASDHDNMMLLLDKLKTVPVKERRAYFYCAIAFVRQADDPTPMIATGYCSGYINQEPAGSNGFGYDPIFYIPEYQQTFAQLSSDIKNKISHRAKALEQLIQLLNQSPNSMTSFPE